MNIYTVMSITSNYWHYELSRATTMTTIIALDFCLFYCAIYYSVFFSLAILERIKMNWDCQHMYALQFDLWQMRATISQIDARPAADTKCITYQNNIFHVIPIRSNVFFFLIISILFSHISFLHACVCLLVRFHKCFFVQCPFDVVCTLYIFFLFLSLLYGNCNRIRKLNMTYTQECKWKAILCDKYGWYTVEKIEFADLQNDDGGKNKIHGANDRKRKRDTEKRSKW